MRLWLTKTSDRESITVAGVRRDEGKRHHLISIQDNLMQSPTKTKTELNQHKYVSTAEHQTKYSIYLTIMHQYRRSYQEKQNKIKSS